MRPIRESRHDKDPDVLYRLKAERRILPELSDQSEDEGEVKIKENAEPIVELRFSEDELLPGDPALEMSDSMSECMEEFATSEFDEDTDSFSLSYL